jgi:hypothetical protein
VVVPEINLRHDHRLAEINDGRLLRRNITSRQNKHLLAFGPVHPDAQEAQGVEAGESKGFTLANPAPARAASFASRTAPAHLFSDQA